MPPQPEAKPEVQESADDALIVPPPTDPMAVARQFVAEHQTEAEGTSLLRHHRGDFYTWRGTCWPEDEDRRIRADLYKWLERALFWTPDGLVPYAPNRNKVANVLEALQAVTHLDAATSAPAWLGEGGRFPASEVVAMANGLFHLRSRELLPHTPRFFTQYALPFAYDPNARSPKRWLRFLAEVWEDDQEASDTLAEIMGYVLGGGTSQQKLFTLVGPKRSGKGTIGRVLTGLLGPHNVAAPTLAGLTTNFGLSPLIGKPLALISDARLGRRSDGTIAVERLLSISGEDSLTIDRKYREPWTGRLPSRFLILTNELPRFTDSSGALASRFVLLTSHRSFFGKEDPTLTDKLLEEAPSIFNWALEGLDRLLDRGYFVQPESAREALRHLEDMSSPVGAFVRDRCEMGPAFEVGKDELFAAWQSWCSEEGRAHPGTKSVFARDLRAAVPGLVAGKPGSRGEQRRRIFRGLRLAPQSSWPGTRTDTEVVAGRGLGHRHRGPDSGGSRVFGSGGLSYDPHEPLPPTAEEAERVREGRAKWEAARAEHLERFPEQPERVASARQKPQRRVLLLAKTLCLPKRSNSLKVARRSGCRGKRHERCQQAGATLALLRLLWH